MSKSATRSHPPKIPLLEPLPGFRVIAPVVYAGIYPVDSSDFEMLRDALYKLQLNDSALHVEQESSMALGFGFRCGFLGLLHLEIVFERLQRHFQSRYHHDSARASSISSPSRTAKIVEIDNVAHYPDPAHIQSVEEPWVKCHIMAPSEYLGAIMSLGMDKRGLFRKNRNDGQTAPPHLPHAAQRDHHRLQ
jgi:GTP-binding protein LepA